MIVSDRHQLVFLHIPKCAGTTVMQALESFDTFSRQHGRAFVHPLFGSMNFFHLPLDVLRDYFPEQFAKTISYHSYAILREPRRRFTSALLHYLRAFHGTRISPEDLARLRPLLAELRARLQSPSERQKIDLAVFQQQVRFVILDGEKVVQNLYSFECLAQLANDLRTRHGIVADLTTRHNPAQLAETPIRRMARVAWRPLSGTVPPVCRRVLKKGAHRLLDRAVGAVHSALFADPSWCNFVDDYYAADAALYRVVRGEV